MNLRTKYQLFIVMLSTLLTTAVFANENQNVEPSFKEKLSQLIWENEHQDMMRKSDKFKRILEKRLNNNEIIGIELIVAGSSGKNIYTNFGHILLRFVDNNHRYGDDITMALVAKVDTPYINYMKGLFGSYGMYPIFSNFRAVHSLYEKENNRTITRHILPTTRAQRELIINEVLDKENYELFGDYTFINNNCAYAISKLLKRAGLNQRMAFSKRIPTSLPSVMRKSFLISYPKVQLDGTNKVKTKIQNNIPLESWATNEIQIALDQELYSRELLIEEYKTRKDRYSYDEMYNFRPYEEKLYSLCEDLACANEVTELLSENFGQDIISKMQEKASWYYKSLVTIRAGNPRNRVNRKRPFPSSLRKNNRHLKHLYLLKILPKDYSIEQ